MSLKYITNDLLKARLSKAKRVNFGAKTTIKEKPSICFVLDTYYQAFPFQYENIRLIDKETYSKVRSYIKRNHLVNVINLYDE